MNSRRNIKYAVMFTTILIMTLMSVFPVFADDSCTIEISPNLTVIEVTKGGREQLDLSALFSDSLGHELTYTLNESEESLKARIKDGTLLIDPLELGEFEVKITARCEVSGVEKQITIPVNIVESEDEGNPAQYGYDETPAESVSVYVTVSNDGIPLLGNDADNTVLAHLKVDVPYFDLGLYGLEKYYRYHTNGGKGDYIDDEIVERPTAMHLFIYMTERYYMGIPEDECCQGTSGLLNYDKPVTMLNMYGDMSYEGNRNAYKLTGGPTSSYMQNFWGHDENLMYYRNHFYPLMSPGWGSTSDYQLLSDGNTIDLAMYTNWGFYQGGAFCCFDKDKYDIGTGEMLVFGTQYASSSMFGSGELSPIKGLVTEVYDEQWNKIDTLESVTSGFGYTFNEPGTYYLLGRDENVGTSKANKSPATAIVKVTDSFKDYSFSSIRDQNGALLPRIETLEDISGIEHFHVSVPSGTAETIIEWPSLPEQDLKIIYWDFTTKQMIQTEETAAKNGNTITVVPSDWLSDNKAIIFMDGQENAFGAFTFNFYTPEEVNFSPQLKPGISALTKNSWREKKEFRVKMSDIFIDYDGDAMTYTVSVDGEDPVDIEDEYTFYSELQGKHTLVFTPMDSKGKTGDVYTLEITITGNQAPDYMNSSNQAREVSIRYNETAKLDMLEIFSDFDNDDLTYSMSVDGGGYEPFEPVYEREAVQIEHHARWNYIDHMYYKYLPGDTSEVGIHEFRFKAKDDLEAVSEEYTFTVDVVQNEAPVSKQDVMVDQCMLEHFWYFDYYKAFTDPEGDAMTYTVSVNGGAPMPCERFREDTSIAKHRLLISAEDTYHLVFYATDVYGETGSCTVNIYPVKEELHEVRIADNVLDACEEGAVVYDVDNRYPATRITGYELSKNITLTGARYSVWNGEYNYYLDIDGYGITPDEEFTMTMLSEPSSEGLFLGPGLDTDDSIFNTHAALKAKDGMGVFQMVWNHQDADYTESFPVSHRKYYRIGVNIVDVDEVLRPEALSSESLQDVFYAGESTESIAVKCRYSDGIARYVNNAVITPTVFDEAGSQDVVIRAEGLVLTKSVDVQTVPSYMAILDHRGKYGRIRYVYVADENGDPVEGAVVEAEQPEMNPDYSDEYYDRGKNYKNILRSRRGIQIRLPMNYLADSSVYLRFVTLRDEPYSNDAFVGEGVSYMDENGDTIGSLKIDIRNGTGFGNLNWYNTRARYTSSFRYAFDEFVVNVKIGACEIIGKVSSWDEKDNAEFLAYPADMTDAEIRADALGGRDEAFVTITAMEEAVKADARYERSFKVEGLDAGKYKLAVIKPGKYTVSVVEAEIDGTDDIGTVSLRLYGDINNDGKVRAGDATQICRYIAGNRSLTDEEFVAADVNLDGKVRAGDATQICRYIASNNSTFDALK